MGISTFPAPSAGAVSKNYKEQIFNASGTWTYPSSSNFDGTVEVTCIGGGGAGGGFKNSSGQNANGITGGGGGGRVILNQKISVLNSGNQTVTVGNGGVSNWASGFGSSSGRYSVFGSPNIANYYPDPHMRWGTWHNGSNSPRQYPESDYSSTVSSNHAWVRSRTIDSSYDTGYGAKSGGLGNGSEFGGVTNGSIAPYTTLFQVPASTSFKIMFYYTWMGRSSAGNAIPIMKWFDSNNVYISEDSTASFTTPTSGTTFTQYTSSAFTSPANAAWCRIVMDNGGGVGYNGITLTPTSLGLTTPVSGNSTGYQWGGSINGSVTVKTNDSNLSNFVIAQGGGAGAGIANYSGNQLLAGNSGLWGWTQGGYSSSTGNTSSMGTSEWFFGSAGGGAGGNATEPTFEGGYTTASTATTAFQGTGSYTLYTSMFGSQIQYCGTLVTMDNIAYYGGGVASYPMYFQTGAANHYPFAFGASGGEGIQGYGDGGNSRFISGVSGVNFTARGWNKGKGLKGHSNRPQASSMSKLNVAANTGSGGIGLYMNGESENGTEGQSGSSGLVIVRWYE
jgi:hypothetical protein